MWTTATPQPCFTSSCILFLSVLFLFTKPWFFSSLFLMTRRTREGEGEGKKPKGVLWLSSVPVLLLLLLQNSTVLSPFRLRVSQANHAVNNWLHPKKRAQRETGRGETSRPVRGKLRPKAMEEHILPVRSVSYLSRSSSLPLSSLPSSRSEESHNDLESAPAAAAIVCAGCTPDSLNQLLWLGGGGGVLAGRVECQSQGGGSSGHTHMHTHSHTNTSHTFRGGRRRADMKRCYLRGRKKRGEEGEKEGWSGKKKTAALFSPSCAFWGGRAGRMPWSVDEAESVPTVLPPFLFLIPSTQAQPQSFILLLKCAFIIQWNFTHSRLDEGSLLNVWKRKWDGGIYKNK